eukprot:COSAG01_NODE_8651_length_2706_cov_5.179831_2_plen_136_part_00
MSRPSSWHSSSYTGIHILIHSNTLCVLCQVLFAIIIDISTLNTTHMLVALTFAPIVHNIIVERTAAAAAWWLCCRHRPPRRRAHRRRASSVHPPQRRDAMAVEGVPPAKTVAELEKTSYELRVRLCKLKIMIRGF